MKRWIVFAGLAAVVGATVVSGLLLYDRAQEVGATDATDFAEEYGEQHRTRGETLGEWGCESNDAAAGEHTCTIRYEPSGRGYVLELRVAAGGEAFDVRSVQRKSHLPSKAWPPPGSD